MGRSGKGAVGNSCDAGLALNPLFIAIRITKEHTNIEAVFAFKFGPNPDIGWGSCCRLPIYHFYHLRPITTPYRPLPRNNAGDGQAFGFQ